MSLKLKRLRGLVRAVMYTIKETRSSHRDYVTMSAGEVAITLAANGVDCYDDDVPMVLKMTKLYFLIAGRKKR